MREPTFEELALVRGLEERGKLKESDFPLSKKKFEEWFAEMMVSIRETLDFNMVLEKPK